METTLDRSPSYTDLAERERVASDKRDDYFETFRDVWLASTLDAATFMRVRNLPESYLSALYPRVYVQGTNAPKLEHAVRTLTGWLDDSSITTEAWHGFYRDLLETYADMWSQLEDEGEWDVIHDACERLGLGGALILGSELTGPDARHLRKVIDQVSGGRQLSATRLYNALTIFTQMILIRDLIDTTGMRYERFEVDSDGMEWGYGEDGEFREGITLSEPVYLIRKFFSAHDRFMHDWELA